VHSINSVSINWINLCSSIYLGSFVISMKLKTAWWSMMIIYCLDLLILTPYALWKYNVREVGLLCSWGFETLGFIYFPIWGLIFGVILWLWLEFFWWVTWKLPANCREIPRWTIVIVWVILMGWTIIQNLGVLWKL